MLPQSLSPRFFLLPLVATVALLTHPAFADEPPAPTLAGKPVPEDRLLAPPAPLPPLSQSLQALGWMDAPIETNISPETQRRIAQAKELLGPRFETSLVSEVSQDRSTQAVDAWVHRWVGEALPKKWRKSSRKISSVLLREARRQHFDPIFLLAVIQSESSFRPEAKGLDGEIGLMQIMPNTGREFARRAGVKWKGKQTLQDPISNIRIGAEFLSALRKRFDSHGRLYLAAYNMGAGNVKEALSRRTWPKDYPMRVMTHYLELYRQVKES